MIHITYNEILILNPKGRVRMIYYSSNAIKIFSLIQWCNCIILFLLYINERFNYVKRRISKVFIITGRLIGNS